MSGSGDAATVRRSRRDWVVDIAMFLLAVAWGLYLSGERVALSRFPDPPWLFDLDQVTGAVGCAALWLRRRWPVQLAVALVAVSTYSELASGAMLAALFTVAIHRPPRTAGILFALSLVAAFVYVLVRPEPDAPAALLFVLGAALQGAAVGWGLFVRHRRQLAQANAQNAQSERDRAQQAEIEARLRLEQAQMRTREQIAREMHDVLGHRLSLLSVQAGALRFHPDAPPEEVARAAEVVRDSAHQALQDLREIIGVLRAPVGELPQPTLADVRELVAESSRAGMRVELKEEVEPETIARIPDRAGRTAYRVVQEALTNARKHATGAEVTVRVSGAAGDGLTVEVSNTAAGAVSEDRAVRADAAGQTASEATTPAAVTPPATPGSGQGLVGLAERVALAGGRLEHGPTDAGGWRVGAWLPWPA
jgi:signal transduction histidine kinase